jgi:hypothetical protein
MVASPVRLWFSFQDEYSQNKIKREAVFSNKEFKSKGRRGEFQIPKTNSIRNVFFRQDERDGLDFKIDPG